MKTYKSVDEYIKNFEGETLSKVLELRKITKVVVSKNKNIFEEIKYGIPTLVLKENKKSKNLFHYGGFKTHVSVFPGPKVLLAFKKEIQKFETSKGTIKFPSDEKLPVGLIKKIMKQAIKNSLY